MKKSELKNIIKEIISEIKVVRGNSNLDDFNRMLELYIYRRIYST